VELQTAIGTLLTRFPRLRLAVPEEELKWRTGMVTRGLQELPLLWS
jgi:cytochrome P450